MSFLSVILIFLNAYPWSMKNGSGNFNGPLTVYATLGDARGKSSPPIVNRFHHGIDIVASNGTAVYSVISDTANTFRTATEESRGANAFVQVGNYWYIHVKDDATRIPNRTPVTGILEDSLNPTKIAEVRDYGDPGIAYDHLHFQIGPPGAIYNPLAEYYNEDGELAFGYPNNYIDTFPPEVGKPTFWKEGCENLPRSLRTQLFDELWGKLEVQAKARDKKISYRGRDEESTGIFSLDWILKPKGDEGVQYIHNTLSFDQVQPPNNYLPVTQIYDTTVTRHANSETFHYWLTNPIINHQVEDRHLNTKLKEGEEWNGDDALINKEAAYKDGWYRIWALGYDIKGNGGDTVTRKGADFTDVFFDNYVPFVDEVTVKKEEEVRYNGKWELSGDEMELDVPTDDSVSVGNSIHIVINFSEVMKSQISVKIEKDGDEVEVEGSWKEDEPSWEGKVTIPDEEESEGEWTVSISSKDLADNLLDASPNTIGMRDEEGEWVDYEVGDTRDKNHKILVGVPTPPRVLHTDPPDISKDAPVEAPIMITFSKPMDVVATADAVQTSFACNKLWSGYEELRLNPDDHLDYCEEYTITITDAAKDTAGVKLDGNTDSDGKPGGAHVFTFTTEAPDIKLNIDPAVANVEEGHPLTADFNTDGSGLKKEFDCNIDFNVDNSGGWSVTEISEPSFSLPPGETHPDNFTVSNNGAAAPLRVTSRIPVNCDIIYNEGFYWSAQGHQHDHPDENQSPGKMEYPTPWITRTKTIPAVSGLRGASPGVGLPDVGILLSGWADGYGHILGKYGMETLPIKPNLQIINQPDVDISDSVKLLVIGSAGLKGFNSPTFKQDLENYVINGGNLLVFTQKYGADLSVLPGDIGGYGWNEDQSCFKNAAYLNQWHPIFAGQTKQVMTCNVDGYISEYPANSEVLLGRTKNAMPALLYYNYGAGTVIVSSLYTDWGYGHNQRSGEELKLVRDLTTWAVNPDMEIPEFYRGSAVSVPVSIKYTANDTLNATTAIIKVYTPDRKLYDSLSVPVSLTNGEETEWLWNESSISSYYGLWVIDYALMNENDEWIQGYNRGAVFAYKVKVPVGDYSLGDFELWVSSDKEEILKGDTVNFEIFITNNTDSSLTGKLIVAINHQTVAIDSFLDLTLPPDSTVNIDYTRIFSHSRTMRFGLYDSDRYDYEADLKNAIAFDHRGVRVVETPFEISIPRFKYQNVLGVDTIHYTVNARNELSDSCSTFIDVYTLMDSVRHDLWSDTLELAGKEKKEFNKVFFPADYHPTGKIGKLRCDLFFMDSLWAFKKRSFRLIYPSVKCSLAIPDSFNYGDSNLYTVTLSSEVDYIPSGKLLIKGINFSDSIIIDNAPTPETTFVFNYDPYEWEISGRVSNNKLKVQYQYGDKKVTKQKNLPFRLPLVSAFRPDCPTPQGGFMPEDTAVFNAQLALTGNLYGVPLEFCLWSDYLGSDTLRDTITLNPCSHRIITLKTFADISLPADTLISYNYRINYLNKEYTTTEELQYTVLSPEAVLHWPVNDTFSIGATVPIGFTNEIKASSRVNIESVHLRGDYSTDYVGKLFDGPGEVEIPGEGSYTFPITVPGWITGQYWLGVSAEMVEGKGVDLDLFAYGCPIYIDGIEADIQVSSSKDYYGYGEDIPFSSLLGNGKYGWTGTETLSVYRTETTMEDFSIWDIADEIDTFGLIPDGSGGLVLDSVYSLRCTQNRELSGYRGYNYSITVDEWDNFWVSYKDYNDIGKTKIEKWDKFGAGNLLSRFAFPDSITGTIKEIVPFLGTIYFASDKGMVYKLNSTSGEIIGSIQPPGRKFIELTDVSVKENGNILVIESGTKTLWEFSSSGDSISTFILPSDLEYYFSDMDYYNGTIYISTARKIITIEGTSIDSFGFDISDYYNVPVASYISIAINDNGKIAAHLDLGEGGGSHMIIFSPDKKFKAGTFTWGYQVDDLTFSGNVIVTCEERWGRDFFNIYRESGKENGLLEISSFSYPTRDFLFHSHKSVEVANSGSVLYQVPGPLWTPFNEDFLPLESFYGSHYITSIYINIQGDWHDSPVFYDCLLNLKVLNVLDSLIVKKGYDLNLSPSDNVSFADTIKDTIPPGNYCVSGDAYSEYPQQIDHDWNLFTVVEDNVTFLLKSDREEGFVGDTFRINPILINPLPLKQDSVYFTAGKITTDSFTTIYLDTLVSLEAGAVDSFPFTITPEEPLIIGGWLHIPPSYDIIKDFSPIIKNNRLLALNIDAPDIADLSPFRVKSEVYNYSFDNLSVEVKRIFSSDTLSDSVNLDIEGAYTFVDSFVTEEPGTLKVIATTGGEVFTEEKFIDFGFTGIVELDSLYEVSPDSVEMSGIIRNEGLYPLNAQALFCLVEDDGTSYGIEDKNETTAVPGGRQFSTSKLNLSTTPPGNGTPYGIGVNQVATSIPQGKQLNNSIDLSAKRAALSSVARVGKDITLSQFVRQLTRAGVDTSFSAIYLPPGKKDTVPIMFDRHEAGSYELQAYLFTDSSSFMFDSTSSSVNVVGDDQIFIDSIIVSENCDTNGNVPLTVILDNKSYSPFFGNLMISSLVCYFDSVVEVSTNSRDTVIFMLEDAIDEGEYPFTATVSEGGIPVSEKSQNLEFRPIYRFDSLPVDLRVSTPDSGIIEVLVSNIGNARGERRVAVNLADVIGINEDAFIEPASIDTFASIFLIPEDFPGGEYFADAYILKNAYPEIDTFFNVKVNGLVIKAADSLDKFVYNVNDTADLSILIENQSLWSGNLLASLQYGELEVDTSFILGGMEKGVLNETLPRDTIYLDTSGIYMFDPINSESYDSVRIDWNASLSDSLIFQMRTDSLIGREDWITLEKGGTYVIDDWMQINFANKSPGVQWIDAICLFFNSLGCTKLDTFPLQREIVTFEVPVDSSENKLRWGIYYPSGRSVVLDERYVYLSDSMLTLFTDKGRYEIFDTVHATLCKNFPDTNYNFEYRVYFSPTEEIRDSFDLGEDTARFSFVIPDWTRSGTYSIDYWVESNRTQINADKQDFLLRVDEIGTLPPEPLTATLSSASPGITNLTAKTLNYSIAKPKKVVPYAKQWVLGKPKLNAFSDSAFISGEHLFDVDGITVYFKNAKMDTNLYFSGDTAKIRTEISSDIDLSSDLTISSTGSAVNDIDINLKKDIPNKFEFEYPITGCGRGMNELYLHLTKDSVSLAGCVLYFDVYVSDTTAPAIFILEEPSNTYSSNRSYQVKARIYDPDTNGTPFHDTLYYRISSIGGSDWNALLAHSVRGDTNKYLIPSQPNGTHIEYNLIARDEFGNVGRYPEEGNQDFWVLSPLKPTWEELLYSAAPCAVLRWNSPEEFVYYHCGLYSDTVNINETEVATRFTSQYSPARLTRIGLEIINESAGSVSDTLIVSLYPVEENLLPGAKVDSFVFTDTIEGYTEFSLSGVDMPEEGIFAGIKGSSGLNALLDGYGEGTHTAIKSGVSWELATSGELLMDGIVSHVPPPSMRGPSDILSYDVFRTTNPSNWTKIASGLTGNLYTDTLIQENREYFYKIMVSFGNPADSFFSSSRGMFIDFSPPELDTVIIDELDEDRLLLSAAFRDTSGIAWDSLGYKNGDTINVISEDSCKNNEYFFSITFSGDTLAYFLKVKDLSLIGNYARYPASGFYKWGILSGITEVMIPDSTCLYRMLNVLVGKDVQIRYALSEESNVEIMFFDIMGRKVETLVNETKKAGYYSIPLQSSSLPHGVYFLRMSAGDYNNTVKLVKVK